MVGGYGIGYTYVGQPYVLPVYSGLDPDQWLTSLLRTLKWYVLRELDPDIWDVRFEFPSASDLGEEQPIEKTIIHFEIDNIQNPVFGFGANIYNTVVDEIDGYLTAFEALSHEVNFDVGIWASDRSGGVTSRLIAYQHLSNLFNGAGAYNNVSGLGISIKSFDGASFMKEEINNISIYRVMNMTLMVQLFSRKAHTFIPYVPSGNFVIEGELEDADGILIPDQN